MDDCKIMLPHFEMFSLAFMASYHVDVLLHCSDATHYCTVLFLQQELSQSLFYYIHLEVLGFVGPKS